jgi:hypothetical protein
MILRWYNGAGGWARHVQSIEVRCEETMMCRLTTRASITQAAEREAVVYNAQKQQQAHAGV